MAIDPDRKATKKKRQPITGVQLKLTTGQIIGQNIRRLRKANGYTQKQFAEKLETIEQTVSKIERGVFSPSTDSLMKICTIFGVTPNDLMLDTTKLQAVNAQVIDQQADSFAALTKHMTKIQQLFALADKAHDAGDDADERATIQRIIDLYTPRIDDLRRVAEWLNDNYSTESMRKIEAELRANLVNEE
ncbi:helix-turn-helix domain-containing protein [Lacticaseibacillus mingshuiensis]|uniref:Helix-turn-helix domain-containing protein n=1 Tax=Lacticaseibacillus mingshuiensis TaxID=2799574 RepID=A0ABW4CFK6_9LACO|nr:helix-turn-helix transcriptional regulator [Lacticaseibacillus mingshuiensis]